MARYFDSTTRDIIDALCSRWNSWEHTKHEDTAELIKTLRNMSLECAATREVIKAKVLD